VDGHERQEARFAADLRQKEEEGRRARRTASHTSVERLLTSTSVTIFTEVSAVMMPSRAPSQKEEEAPLNIAGSWLLLISFAKHRPPRHYEASYPSPRES